jgi:geranylgeranyl diphosphate synthase type I
MRYHLGWEDAHGRQTDASAGKMLRPALCLLCCEAAGGDAARALPAAVAIELLHNFTLIHDDIEDESETRHGRETLWRRVGIAQAINAGDGMYTIARRSLLDLTQTGVPAGTVVQAAQFLDHACVQLCEGQYMDLSFESREAVSPGEYLAMVGGKSAALIAGACAIGALAAGGDGQTAHQYGEFGWSLGLAFQIQDDVLGVWGDPARTGKPRGDDIRARKKSFPIVHAMSSLDGAEQQKLMRLYASASGENHVDEVMQLLERAGARGAAIESARAHADAALSALSVLEIEPGLDADLQALARFAVSREA